MKLILIVNLLLSSTCVAAYRDATAYGAKGDNGVTDDYAAIQAALTATKEGDTFRLPRAPGGGPRVYRISRGLIHTASRTKLLFNGNTLLLDTAAYPFNTHLLITSPISAEPIFWNAEIKAGWYSLPIKARPAFVGFGTDPFDPAEEHWQTFVPKESYSIFIPRDIIGKRHFMSPLKSITEDVLIKDFKADHTNSAIPDMNICFYRVRSVKLEGLTGRVTAGVQLADVDHASLSGINVDLVDLRERGHTSSNRAVAMWGTRDVVVTDLVMRGDRSGGIMIENQCEAIQFDSIKASFASNKDWFGDAIPLLMVTGNSQVKIKKIFAESNSLIYINDRGGQNTPLPSIDLLQIGKGWAHLVNELQQSGAAPWNKLERSVE